MGRISSQLDARDTVEVQEEVHQVRGRRKRSGLGGVADILSVSFKDPAFEEEFYWYWELGDDENSPAIYNAIEYLGYEFVRPEELAGTQANYQKSVSAGSVVRVQAGKKQSGWLYLLKQPMEYRKEDLAAMLEEGQAPVKAMRRSANESSRATGVGKFEQGYQSI